MPKQNVQLVRKRETENKSSEIKDVYNVETEVLSEQEVKNVEQIALDKKETFKKHIEEYKMLDSKT
ncbi:putative immunity/bacteriocin fusion bifunctional protein [Bacillus vallismortis]|uniref:putative immunity/bacteriocin fusion bifunctional protein n=1 Tax=Bacillus vallismortis TaxID=72361 RepID=UPI0015D52F88|nr:putative immunity/bacteriocin fusion bifunctional protein [Bacillus vallismortis]